MSKKVIAKIDPKTGKIEIKTEGYAGAECLEATKGLETGLGMDQGCAIPSEDMYKQPEQAQQKVGE